VVAPDAGSIKMARAYAKRLGASLALVDKRRTGADESEVMFVIGDVDGKNVIIFDDVISTGKTIANAAIALDKKGAKAIYVGATHAVLSGAAPKNLRNSPVREVVVTDTLTLRPELRWEGLVTLSVSRLLGEAIRRIHEERSLSSLFV